MSSHRSISRGDSVANPTDTLTDVISKCKDIFHHDLKKFQIKYNTHWKIDKCGNYYARPQSNEAVFLRNNALLDMGVLRQRPSDIIAVVRMLCVGPKNENPQYPEHICYQLGPFVYG